MFDHDKAQKELKDAKDTRPIFDVVYYRDNGSEPTSRHVIESCKAETQHEAEDRLQEFMGPNKSVQARAD